MLLHLLTSVERVISAYENLFTTNKPMPLYRAQDIIELRNLLKPMDYDNCHVAIRRIQSKLDEFKTGWWIFKTGHSQLKSNISRVLDYFRDDLVNALYQSMQEIYGVVEAVPMARIQPSHEAKIQQLNLKIEFLTQKNVKLQTQLHELEVENKKLLGVIDAHQEQEEAQQDNLSHERNHHMSLNRRRNRDN